MEAIFTKALLLEKEARFNEAKVLYEDMLRHATDEHIRTRAQIRLEDMDSLIEEKAIYQRIHENGKRVLTEIGVNIAESPILLDILVEAGAIDFTHETAPFIPLKKSYIDYCLEQVPRQMVGDPGTNAFGTGSTSPFLKRAGEDELRPANRQEYEEITRLVAEQDDIIDIFSVPVNCDKTISLFEVAQLMDRAYKGLKMITTNTMADDEVSFLQGKEDWLDGTSLLTSLTPMTSMVKPFLRSASTGNNLLLIDQPIAGISGPGSPESFLTHTHAQVMFMMIIAQTITPGLLCLHGGIPSVIDSNGNLSYSSPQQTFINAAMARVNRWVSGFPSAQTGGSTSLSHVTAEAVEESELSRNSLRKYGVHILRHAMGALGSLNYFSLEKLAEDCERERHARKIFEGCGEEMGVVPLYFPGDDDGFEGIREIAEKGNPKSAEHTLKNVDSFRQWETVICNAAARKCYCPQLRDQTTPHPEN